MAREGRDCVEILTQIASIRAALDQVGIELLTHHMRDRAAGEGCKADAGIEAAERTEELRTALNRLLT
ncbi:MAG: metal-sensitive transcriptional regulator [Myxococcales bacterium]|nr:MAG: metal-sensitive transcriptional regulator [Myxococcales bacterium]